MFVRIFLFIGDILMMTSSNFIKNVKETLHIKPFHSSSMSVVEQQKQNQSLSRFALVSIGVYFFALEPSLAMAAAAATTSNLETAATTILSGLTGTLGKTLATIAVIVLGMMAMFGKLAWDTAIKVILGIAIMFGAASIVNWIGGSMSTTIAT